MLQHMCRSGSEPLTCLFWTKNWTLDFTAIYWHYFVDSYHWLPVPSLLLFLLANCCKWSIRVRVTWLDAIKRQDITLLKRMTFISMMLPFTPGSEERQTVGLQQKKGQAHDMWAGFPYARTSCRTLHGISTCLWLLPDLLDCVNALCAAEIQRNFYDCKKKLIAKVLQKMEQRGLAVLWRPLSINSGSLNASIYRITIRTLTCGQSSTNRMIKTMLPHCQSWKKSWNSSQVASLHHPATWLVHKSYHVPVVTWPLMTWVCFDSSFRSFLNWQSIHRGKDLNLNL